MDYGYDVYVQVDLKSRVTAVNSSAFISDYTSWVLLESNVQGDKGHHAQGNYFPQPIITDEGVPRYKLVGGKAMERTTEEIQADIDAIPPPPPDPLQVTQKAAAVMFRALAQTDVITKSDALDNAEMFPVWADCIGQRAEPGSYWRHGGKLYSVNAGQGHAIQADWAPDKAVSLFSLAANPAEEWPEWIQPTGAHNAYAKGAKVTHGGKRWVSTAYGNVWSPGAYGWEESK
jgi:hypothetical protein